MQLHCSAWTPVDKSTCEEVSCDSKTCLGAYCVHVRLGTASSSHRRPHYSNVTPPQLEHDSFNHDCTRPYPP
jgi:hypothetical protein